MLRSTLLLVALLGLVPLPSSAATPREVNAWREKARAAAAAKRFDEAIELIQRAAEARPAADVYKEAAEICSWANRTDAAATWYRKVLTLVPHDEATRLAFGTMLSWSKQRSHQDEALRLLDTLLARRPGNVAALLQRGRLRGWMGQIAPAAADYRAYLATHPHDEKVRAELASVLSWSKDKGDITQALELLDAHLAKNPGDDERRVQRARVRGWAGQIDGAVADFNAYLARRPNDEQVQVELATVLSWSKDQAHLKRALAMFDVYLAKHPGDDERRLQRARIKAWLGMIDAAATDFQALLVKRPGDPKIELELATVLSWSKDKAQIRRAAAILDGHLARKPQDLERRLQRARIRAWLGLTDGSAADFRVCLAAREDPAVRLELARSLAWGNRLSEALAEFDRLQGTFEARLGRALVLRWSGQVGRAESELDALARTASTPALRRMVDIERARVYAETSRRVKALRLLDAVLARDPSDTEARQERERQGLFFRPAIIPGFSLYTDKGGINIISLTLSGRFFLHPLVNLTLETGTWRLANAPEAIWSERIDLGAQARLFDLLEVEAAAGPRIYQYFSTKAGGHVALSSRPLSWLGAGVRYTYDDIYQDLYQPASVPAQIRGHWVYGEVEATIPWIPFRVTAAGRLGGHFLAPQNTSIEASGSVMFNVWRLLSAGYAVQWLRWNENDPAYWSPQGYVAHMFVARATQSLNTIGLHYDVQASIGAAAERVAGIANAGWAVAWGAGAGLVYQPIPRLSFRLSLSYGQTARELTTVIVPPSSTQTPPCNPPLVTTNCAGTSTTHKETSTYWWVSTNFAMTIIL